MFVSCYRKLLARERRDEFTKMQTAYYSSIIHQPKAPLARVSANAPSASSGFLKDMSHRTGRELDQAFSLLPEARFCYLTARHKHGLQRISWALNGRSLALISGEAGSGKTTMLLRLAEELENTGEYETRIVRTPLRRTTSAFSCAIAGAAGLFPTRTTYDDVRQVAVLAGEVYARGKRLVLLVDDADRLTKRMCGVLHALAVVTVGHDLAIGIVLAGGLRLEKRLRGYPALESRVGARLNLSPLTPEETREMILFRCRAAGVPAPPPLDANLQRLHRLSHGDAVRVVAACLAVGW